MQLCYLVFFNKRKFHDYDDVDDDGDGDDDDGVDDD